MKLNDIEEAVDFVSSSMYGEHSAMLCRSTGEILWSSESGDMDEIPEEAYESDDWVAIPHKNDLDLGRDLVFDFVAEHLPAQQDRICDIFRRRGAYSRYKDLLGAKGKLQEWYDYEKEHTLSALRQWCQENDVEITE